MNPRSRKYLGGAIVCGIAMLGLARMGQAQESTKPLPTGSTLQSSNGAELAAPQGPDADLRARIERLERQNQELMNALHNVSAHTGTTAPAGESVGRDEVQKIVADYIASHDPPPAAAGAAKKDPADGYRVGSDLNMKGSWKDGLLFSTPQQDFTLHLGGWVQYDNVFWNQSGLLRLAPGARPGAKQGVASGAALGGIGDL